MKLYGAPSTDRDTKDILLSDCLSHDNGQGGEAGVGFRTSDPNAHDNVLRDCLSYDNRTGGNSDRFLINVGAHNNRFVNCVTVSNPDGGFETYGESDRGQEFIGCVAAKGGITSDGTKGNGSDEGNGVGRRPRRRGGLSSGASVPERGDLSRTRSVVHGDRRTDRSEAVLSPAYSMNRNPKPTKVDRNVVKVECNYFHREGRARYSPERGTRRDGS